LALCASCHASSQLCPKMGHLAMHKSAANLQCADKDSAVAPISDALHVAHMHIYASLTSRFMAADYKPVFG
jgi:hypothetical protein